MKYHLVGIGGTGMGALAGILTAAGHEVRGSDRTLYPPMSDQLAALEIPVFEGFAAANLDWGPDVVVVGNVCTRDHVEVVEAGARGLAMKSFPAVLEEMFLSSKRSLVIAGTHGKTTTTALLGHILVEAQHDPGIFVGGVPLNLGQGWRHGEGAVFVIEGDEYDSAFFDKGSKFLHYRPHHAVLTSVEMDHIDIFAGLENVREAFRQFISLIPEDGLLVAWAGSHEALAIARSHARCRVETYAVGGVSDAEKQATWSARNVTQTKSGRCRFELRRDGELFDRYETLLVGVHNVANTVAAIAMAHSVGVAGNEIRRGVSSFAGVKRRQEVCGIAQGVYVIDDYAHHPTAVKETLQALRKRFPRRRLVAVFEPRSATSRRKLFQREYVQALSHADSVTIGRLHDASAIPEDQRLDPDRLALDLHQSGTHATYIANIDEAVAHIAGSSRPGDVVAILSSGGFDGLHGKLLAALGDAVRPATRHDMRDVRALAGELGWLADQHTDEMFGDFFVLYNETGFVGCVAIEVYGEAAILRSLAIRKEARNVGYGWLLADTAVTVARHRGVKRIYLLTQDARSFFAAKLGFRVVDLSTVSHVVANSPTFRSQQDSGAIAMRLDL